MKNSAVILTLCLLCLTACLQVDNEQCIEDLENMSGKTMPSFTECLDQYSVNEVLVYSVQMDSVKQMEFMGRHGFVNVCEDTVSLNLNCQQKLDKHKRFIKRVVSNRINVISQLRCYIFTV